MKGRPALRLPAIRPLKLFKNSTNRPLSETINTMSNRANTPAVLLRLIDALPAALEAKDEIDQFLEQAAQQYNLRPTSGRSMNNRFDAAGLRSVLGSLYRTHKTDTGPEQDTTNHGMIFKHGSAIVKTKYLRSIGYTASAGQEVQAPGADEEETTEQVSRIVGPSSPQVKGPTKRSLPTDNGDGLDERPAKSAKVSIEQLPFPNTFLGDNDITYHVATLQSESLNAVSVFLQDIGSETSSDIQIVVTPSQGLAALYAAVFDDTDYQTAAMAVIAADTIKAGTLLRSMIAAYLVDNIFRKKLPWAAVHHILSTHIGERLARVISRQRLPGDEVVRQASVEQVLDEDFQKDTVAPAANLMAKNMVHTLLPHLKLYRRSDNFAQACVELVPRLSELCRLALILYAQLDAAPHDFFVLWPLKQPFDRTTMIQQGGTFRNGEVAMVVFPGFHCTPSDLNRWPESTSARSLVNVTFRRSDSPTL